ncbi:MAG: translation initiation factor IF-2 subunit gamma [Promethearchaeota archaeon]
MTNVGMVGHVDHGKTTLIEALSGEWTDRYSEEQEKGISIKLGYSDTTIVQCPNCETYYTYFLANKLKPKKQKRNTCPKCAVPLKFKRKISFVDAPGHEILMATMLSGASLMDGACLLISANEKCPQPQTREHLAALEISGIDKIIIIQNKIDAVSRERAIENFHEIKEFIKGTIAENAPIIPVSAVFKINISEVIRAIEEIIPTPSYNEKKPPIFYIARSFDINKPGTPIEKLVGGVIGGSVSQGIFKIGDKIQILPGFKKDKKYIPLRTTIHSIYQGRTPLKVARPGGLVAFGTDLDPSLTKADNLVGNIAGFEGKMPSVLYRCSIKVKLFDKVLGAEKEIPVDPIKLKEPMLLVVNTTLTSGIVTEIKKKGIVHFSLKRPICAEYGSTVAISRLINKRYRLIGHGTLVKEN